jgi:hypothetical protein
MTVVYTGVGDSASRPYHITEPMWHPICLMFRLAHYPRQTGGGC